MLNEATAVAVLRLISCLLEESVTENCHISSHVHVNVTMLTACVFKAVPRAKELTTLCFVPVTTGSAWRG